MSDAMVSPIPKQNLIAMRDFIASNSAWSPSFAKVIELAKLAQALDLSLLQEDEFLYDYELVDLNNQFVMGTQITGSDIRVDPQFWERFLQGDVLLKFLGRKRMESEDSGQEEVNYGSHIPTLTRLLEAGEL